MRKQGRRANTPEDKLKEALKDYLENELTYEETAEKHKIPMSALKYYARKERQKGNGVK